MVDKTKDWWINFEEFIGFLEERSVETPKKVTKVQDFIKLEIENILWKSPLSQLLILSKEYWLITQSESLVNKLEQEKEIKIEEINKEQVIKDLKTKLWAVKVFQWTVIDIYYDDWQDSIENKEWKVSFRVREKISKDWNRKFYYTIKRKEKKDEDSTEMRVCYEKEFLINDYRLFTQLLSHLGFYETRAKKKDRVAYELWKTKFDIDTYKWIPTLMEIEAETTQIAQTYIKLLWLEGNTTSNSWSRSTFKKYWVDYKTFPKDEKKKKS